jgi:hypothetical protein
VKIKTVHRASRDVKTTAAPFSMHVVDLDTADLGVGDEIVFTIYWNDERLGRPGFSHKDRLTPRRLVDVLTDCN